MSVDSSGIWSDLGHQNLGHLNLWPHQNFLYFTKNFLYFTEKTSLTKISYTFLEKTNPTKTSVIQIFDPTKIFDTFPKKHPNQNFLCLREKTNLTSPFENTDY